VEVEKLVVEPGAFLYISGGTSFLVGEVDDVGAPSTETPVLNQFGDGASLLYGPVASGAVISSFTSWADLPGTDPPLEFLGDSYITTAVDPALSECGDPPVDCKQELTLAARVSIDIEGTLSEPPARSWYTGDVDVYYESAWDPAEFEVIAADVCNVWFTDVPEPRCLKYWRKMRFSKEHNEVSLVDNHDNHVPNPEFTPDPECPESKEALYLREGVDFEAGGSETRMLYTEDYRVYYGGEISQDDPDNRGLICAPPYEPPWQCSDVPIRLIMTHYGDFNGDCLINEEDLRYLYAAAQARGTTEFPLGDYHGDCVVGLKDYLKVHQRIRDPEQNQIPGCNDDPDNPGETLELDCPCWLDEARVAANGGPFPEDMDAETAAALMGLVFFDYLTMTTLPPEDQEVDSNEQGGVDYWELYGVEYLRKDAVDARAEAEAEFVQLIEEGTSLLVEEMTVEQREQLADELESDAITFETELAAELVPSIVAHLRG
jgi:hypothetical protein